MTEHHYTPEQAVEIVSRYLNDGATSRVLVAGLRRPEAFMVDRPLSGLDLANELLRIAERIHEGERDG